MADLNGKAAIAIGAYSGEGLSMVEALSDIGATDRLDKTVCMRKGIDQMSDFEGKVAVITGGARGIGRCTAEMFRSQGAAVCVIDLEELPPEEASAFADLYYQGDISQEQTLRIFAETVIRKYGRIDFLINNAPPLFKGIQDCSYEEFNHALRIGVTAPFFLTKLFMEHFAEGAAVVNISSSRDRMSQPISLCFSVLKKPVSLPERIFVLTAG